MLWENHRFPIVIVKILLTSRKDKRMIAKKGPYWKGRSNSRRVCFLISKRMCLLQTMNFYNVGKHCFLAKGLEGVSLEDLENLTFTILE